MAHQMYSTATPQKHQWHVNTFIVKGADPKKEKEENKPKTKNLTLDLEERKLAQSLNA